MLCIDPNRVNFYCSPCLRRAFCNIGLVISALGILGSSTDYFISELLRTDIKAMLIIYTFKFPQNTRQLTVAHNCQIEVLDIMIYCAYNLTANCGQSYVRYGCANLFGA